MSEQKEKPVRARNFAFLVYPESAPADWLGRIQDLHVPGCVSPLHDRDVYTLPSESHQVGDLKKPHWHCLLAFQGVKTVKQILTALDFLGVSHVEVVHNMSAMVRYFAHLDNQEKAQYDPSKIVGFCGFDVSKYLYSGFTLYQEVSAMIDLIEKMDFRTYAGFFTYCLAEKSSVWIPILLEHGNINNTVRFFIQSRDKHRKKSMTEDEIKMLVKASED